MIRETARHRTAWEQVRFMSHCAMAPHMKKGFLLHDVCVFEWETEAEKPKEIKVCTEQDFERMKKKYGVI